MIVGIDSESDEPFVDPDTEWWHEGEGTFKVPVPAHLVDEFQRALAVWRNARDAILGHVQLDPQTGCLPICGDYDGQAHEWNGRKSWDECWRCGHEQAAHPGRTGGSI